MRSPGLFARHNGRDYPVAFIGGDWVAIRPASDADESDLMPSTIEAGSDSKGTWVKIPESRLERYFRVKLNAIWHDEPVWVEGIGDDGLIGIGYLGSGDFARRHGLVGQEREGFFGEVPEAELSDIQVTEKDLLP